MKTPALPSIETRPAAPARASRRVSVGFFGALLLLAGIGVVSLRNARNARALSLERDQVRRLLVEMKDLFSALQDAETGQRGFLLTGDEKYLDPYPAGRIAVEKHLATIERLGSPYRTATFNIDLSRPLIAAKLAELEETIQARRERGPDAALQIVRSDRGKKAMDDIRRVLGAQESEIEAVLETRVLRQEASSERVLVALVAGGAVSVTVLALSFLWLQREITRRRQAAAAWREANLGLAAEMNERQRAEAERDRFFTLSLDMLAMAKDGRFIRVSPAFTETLGWSAEELLARPFMEFVHPEDCAATLQALDVMKAGRPVRDFEDRYQCKDGSYRVLSWNVTPEVDGLLYGVARDVTEKRRTEALLLATNEELRVATEKAQAADRLKSEFLATMSHELRTPLNSIIGFTGILKQGLPGPVNDEQKKQLGMVYGSAKHLLGLINDILDLARLESGRMEVDAQPFQMEEVVTEVAQTLAPQVGLKGLAFVQDVTAPLPIITGDRKKCYQVLLNLANNAVKFTERGEVRIAARAANGRLTVSVTDTGIGIKPEHRALLFEAFRQIEGSARRVYEGTGLGLHLSRKLLTMLGGDIQVESESGRGSCFTFTVPLIYEPPAPL